MLKSYIYQQRPQKEAKKQCMCPSSLLRFGWLSRRVGSDCIVRFYGDRSRSCHDCGVSVFTVFRCALHISRWIDAYKGNLYAAIFFSILLKLEVQLILCCLAYIYIG